MRFVNVDREGNFSVVGDQRILYGVMMHIRVQIALGSYQALAKGLLIATRYAAVRRQFKTIEGEKKLERKLIDYQTHMFKLAPLLSYAYAFNFAAGSLVKIH